LDPIWIRTEGGEDGYGQIAPIGRDDPAPPDAVRRRETKEAPDTGWKLGWVLRKVNEVLYGNAQKIGPRPDAVG
jgi:hypothetical protein